MLSKLTPADWLVIIFGLTGIGKWVGDTVMHWMKDDSTRERGEEQRITQLLSDFAVHKAEDKKDFQSMDRGIERVEGRLEQIDRTLVGMQHQMAFLATGTNNKFYESGDQN